MASPFYVTPAEKRLLAALPPALTAPWAGRLQDETLDAYETEEQIAERMKGVSYDAFPAAKALIEKTVGTIRNGGDLSTVSFKDFPPEALPTFWYSIGACGVEAMIEISLRSRSIVDAEALEAVAAMSRVRHHLLEENAAHAS